LSSCHSDRIYSGSVLSDISDHFFTFTRPVLPTSKKQTKFSNVRNFSQASMNQFKTALSGTDWSHVTNSNDVDDAYELFWNSYSELFDIIFPKKKVRFNRNIHKMSPFMTAGLLVSRITKNKLFKAKLLDNSAANLQKYKDFKSVYSKTLRAAKKLYYQQKFEANVKNPKKTWETLNEVMGKEKRSANVEKININGNISSDPSDMANHFNEFFTQIGKKISNSIPSVKKKPEDYIDYGRQIPELNLTNTTPEHVKKVISGLAPKPSCDVSGVSTKLIKFIGSSIALPLSHIFNLSLSTGKFPRKLKQCRVIPIFKNGCATECDNYRPISLLSSISKILEKIVAEKLISHLLTNNLL